MNCFRSKNIAGPTLAAVVAFAGIASADEALVMQDFDGDLNGLYQSLDSTVQIVDQGGGKALAITSGTRAPYPNVRVKPRTGVWDLSKYTQVELDITNTSADSVKFGMRVDNEGATGQKGNNTGSVTLDPGETGTLVVRLQRPAPDNLDEKLIGMDRTPWGKRGTMGGSIDVSKVVEVNIFLNKPDRSYTFTIDNLRAAGSFDPASMTVPEPFFPFVDTYGQYVHADWPGKTKSDDDLKRDLAAEEKSIHDFPRPENWNKFGGWATGPQMKATGHFTTTKHDGKWYLVDPEGKLFFSMGIDVVQFGGTTPIDQREGWFQDELWNKPEYANLVTEAKENNKRGDFKGESIRAFPFMTTNLMRKFGPNYEEAWRGLISKRMLNWGFNTLGCWSDPKLLPTSSIPYTHWVFNDGPKLPWRQGVAKRIPDPFAPKFAEVIRRRAGVMIKGTVDDPNCIGYFVDNEIMWGTTESIAETTLLGDATSPAKVVFVEDLKAKYSEISKLNTAWNAQFESWDALLNTKLADARQIPRGPGTKADFEAFTEKAAHSYFSQVRDILKEIAPNKLYLGCRFAEYNTIVVRVAAEYCDVVSFNLYRDTVANWRPPVEIDKPIMIGEFHFGATDRGVFGSGLIPATDAADRAVKFARYMAGAARNPLLVGAHWFQLYDQPTTGRTQDGENHNIGFLSITDRPYQEMIDASRDLANKLYDLRSTVKTEGKSR